ncbi:unnamed protein product [Darwinula stevensoni]|uniref:Sodium/potassium-transporting ATPase subunit beta-1-interacting protein n=1 Tax=Darwinula stevensoni TaxID=69355 RepID=A0A7R9A3Z1_9CRUS|nr:unnamed protein product [Darwinula stevensoni]CAG0891514.1 unnamed protein product [Darwinula stevensoni]
MGCLSVRCYFLTCCALQLVSTAERQVFDLLGYLWLPILLNFVHILFTIIGIFGGYQARWKYVVSCASWNAFWIGWNIFLICLYLRVGVLQDVSLLFTDLDILSLGTGSYSWWEANGPGCMPHYSTNQTLASPYAPPRPVRVENCILGHRTIEATHAGIQIAFSLLLLPAALYLMRVKVPEDDQSGGKSRTTSLYSIELVPDPPFPQRTMTPRRVKRRSLTRSSGRSSTRSRQSTLNRASYLASRHLPSYDPSALDSSTSNDEAYRHLPPPPPRLIQGHINPTYAGSRPSSVASSSVMNGLNTTAEWAPGIDLLMRPKSAQSSYSNFHGQRPAIPASTMRPTRTSTPEWPAPPPPHQLVQGQGRSYHPGLNSETVI